MIQFPSTAHVGKTMPKEHFYKKLDLSPEIKEKFVSDIFRITMEYVLRAESIHVDASDDLAEILVLTIQLKKRDYDDRVIISIAKQNSHKLLFLLKHEAQIQAALYVQNKLYKMPWQSEETAALAIQGRTIKEIWQGFVRQIALPDQNNTPDNQPIEEQLRRQEQIQKLQSEVDKLERQARKEAQPKKKYQLFRQLKDKQKELEDLTHG